MARFKISLEYDGSQFKGWQAQKDEYTIQGVLQQACEKIFKTKDFELYGAGRTDAGVHALEQIAHLEVATNNSPEQIFEAFQNLVPMAIQIIKIQRVHDRFHARHHAKARSYVYVIAKKRTAFFKRFVWWVKEPLSVKRMQNAALEFVGMHDFASFGKVSKKQESTQVEIQHISITEEKNYLVIHVIGSHFLWHQVRRMVGILVEVGKGSISNADVKQMLLEPSDIPSKHTASPSGLFLEHIYYENETINLQPTIPFQI